MKTATATSLRMTRLIQADRQRTFDAWTQPEHLKRWSCPEGMTVDDAQVDLRVGGAYKIRMKGEDGAHTAFGTYREIDPPSRVAYTWQWEETDHMEGETLVSVEFHDREGATEVVITQTGFPDAEATGKHEMGWSSCLNQLERLLA